MKTPILFAFFAALFSFAAAPAFAQVVSKPSIPAHVKKDMDALKKANPKAKFGGDKDSFLDGDYVVINSADNKFAGIYIVSFADNPFGYKSPILTRVGHDEKGNPFEGAGYRYEPTDTIGFRTEDDGTRIYYGHSPYVMNIVYFWCSSFKGTDGKEQYKVCLTWGPGAAYNEPGETIEQPHLGNVQVTEPEPVKEVKVYPVGNPTVSNKKLVVTAYYDVTAKFSAEVSTNLASGWTKIQPVKNDITGTRIGNLQAATFTATPPANAQAFFIRFRSE